MVRGSLTEISYAPFEVVTTLKNNMRRYNRHERCSWITQNRSRQQFFLNNSPSNITKLLTGLVLIRMQ